MPGKVVAIDGRVPEPSDFWEGNPEPKYRPCALRIKMDENRWERLPLTIRSQKRG